MVETDMATSWLPRVTETITTAIFNATREFKDMGLPPAHDIAYTSNADALQALRMAATTALKKPAFSLPSAIARTAWTAKPAAATRTWSTS